MFACMSVWYGLDVMVERWWSPEGAGVTEAEGQIILNLLVSVPRTELGFVGEQILSANEPSLQLSLIYFHPNFGTKCLNHRR